MNLTKKQIAQIRSALKKREVELAYVFGSYAHGTAGPLSDFDIAVVFGGGMDEKDYFENELKLAGEIRSIVKIERADVINLATEKSPLLKHRAVFYGEPILVRNKHVRFCLETEIRQEYEDTKHLRAAQYHYLKKELETKV